MPYREKASDAVEGLAEVVSLLLFDRSCVQGHPHGYVAYVVGPLLGSEGALSGEGSGEGGVGGGKGGAEGIAHGFEDVAVVGLYCGAEEDVVAGQGGLHGGGEVLPAFGTPLYVGEEEGNGAGG